MKKLYGLLGLGSLLGVAGLVTRTEALYPFLFLALFFQYFFREPEENFAEYMSKAAAWAFAVNLVMTAVLTVYCRLIAKLPEAALTRGASAIFGLSLLVFVLGSAYCDWRGKKSEPKE